MDMTGERLWAALYRIGFGEGDKADKKAVARLVELGIAAIGKSGPELTDKGRHMFVINDRSGGDLPELSR